MGSVEREEGVESWQQALQLLARQRRTDDDVAQRVANETVAGRRGGGGEEVRSFIG